MKDLGIELDAIKPQGPRQRQARRHRSTTTTRRSSTAPGGQGRRRLGRVEPRSAAEIENTTSDYDREKLQERLAKLTGGIAQINVGGATDTEVKERKALIEDALHATRAAVEEGILPGGGVALLRARAVLKKLRKNDDDYDMGLDILHEALARPVQLIAENAGFDGPSSPTASCASARASYGFDASRASTATCSSWASSTPPR